MGPRPIVQGIGAWGGKTAFIDGSTTTSTTQNLSRRAVLLWAPTLDFGMTVRSATGT